MMGNEGRGNLHPQQQQQHPHSATANSGAESHSTTYPYSSYGYYQQQQQQYQSNNNQDNTPTTTAAQQPSSTEAPTEQHPPLPNQQQYGYYYPTYPYNYYTYPTTYQQQPYTQNAIANYAHNNQPESEKQSDQMQTDTNEERNEDQTKQSTQPPPPIPIPTQSYVPPTYGIPYTFPTTAQANNTDAQQEPIVVFQCKSCREILGSSLNMVRVDRVLQCGVFEDMSDTVTEDDEIQFIRNKKSDDDEGVVAENCTFKDLRCGNCRVIIGKHYLTTNKDLGHVCDMYTYAIPALLSREITSKSTKPIQPKTYYSQQDIQPLQTDITQLQKALVAFHDRLVNVERAVNSDPNPNTNGVGRIEAAPSTD